MPVDRDRDARRAGGRGREPSAILGRPAATFWARLRRSRSTLDRARHCRSVLVGLAGSLWNIAADGLLGCARGCCRRWRGSRADRRSKARVLAVTGVAGCRLDDLLLGALDPPFSSGRERGLDSIANVEFAKDLLYVRLDRVLAEVNPVGDFTVREPSGNEPDDLQLGVTQGDR